MFNRFISIFLFILLISISINAEDDEYSCNATKGFTDNWISDMINGKQYFEANIEVVDLQTGQSMVSLVDEVYDFGNKAGEIKFQHRFTNKEDCVIEYAKYFKEPSIVYTSSNHSYRCGKKSINDNDLLEKFMLRWLPTEIFHDGQSVAYNTILGPSSMLLHLRERMQDVHMYSFTDEDLILNFVYNLCIGEHFMIKFYHVKELSLEKNLIKVIQILERKKVDENSIKSEQFKWTLRTQFNYYYVGVRSDVHLDTNLPLGLGCEREANDFINPQINNRKFELDLQFVSNQGHSYSEQNINHFNPSFSVIEHHSIYLDQMNNLAVNFRENSNANITKQVHDYSTKVIYKIDLSTGICEQISKDNEIDSIEFNDPLSIIKNIPQLLKLTDKSNYIGVSYSRDIKCEVFEGIFHIEIQGKKQSFIVTHYYSSLNFDRASPDKIPLRIDLRQFADDQFRIQLGYYVFLINKFYAAGLDLGRQDIFDISYCMPHYNQYNWFLIMFTCEPKQIEKLKNAQLALLDEFRKELAISPLRISKILVDYDDTTIYFTTKLLEVPAINEQFKQTVKRKLKNYREFYLTDHEENCAKSCFNKVDCIAFSYCSDMRCAQLMLENYSDDNVNIPVDYIKTETDQNCIVHVRKFKLKRNDLSSKDIRSVMSSLDKKVNTGKFFFEIQMKRANDEVEKINLTATEIVLSVEPGSRQSDYLQDEELTRDTFEKYDQFFSIFKPNYSFDLRKLNQNKEQLAVVLRNLALADCESQCMNDLNCHSFSYCNNNICMLTSAFDSKTIDTNIKSDIGCFISKKNYLSNYAMHENRGIKNRSKKKIILENIEQETPETCAKLCSTSSLDEKNKFDCLSFEYCEAKKTGGDYEKVCLLHELNLQGEKELKLDWDFEQTHCNHYTKKHSTDYREFSMQELVQNDLVEYTKIPLEKCAIKCDEHELCNSFDYCFEQGEQNNGIDLKNLRCRLHTDTYNLKNVKTNSTPCSVYESIRPKIPVKKTIIKQATYSKGVTVALSFVALLSGSSIGVLLSFLIIRKFFRDEEQEF